MIIQCEQCKARYKIDPSKFSKPEIRLRCARCKHVFTVSSKRPCILVAKEDMNFRSFIRELLEKEPFDLVFSGDGADALEKIRQLHPSLAILDVALPKIFGFELAEILKSDPMTRDIRIILLTAIYDKTRYKRLPESLYGADDYIEAHHIKDKLLIKIRNLLPGLSQQQIATKETVRKPDAEKRSFEDTLSEEIRNKSRRLARIIISDIALYNQKKVEEGIKNGNLEQRLAQELQEGEVMMKQRFSELPLNHCRKLLRNEIEALTNKNRAAHTA